MRFTDGIWLMQPNVTPTYVSSITDFHQDGSNVTLFTSPQHLSPAEARRNLGGAMLTIELSAPMEDVIGLRTVHWKGTTKKTPDFTLYTDPADASFTEQPD